MGFRARPEFCSQVILVDRETHVTSSNLFVALVCSFAMLGHAAGSSPGQFRPAQPWVHVITWKTVTLPDPGNRIFAYSLLCH